MTAAVAAPRAPVALGAAVVPLIALAMFINYVDRGNLATAAPLIKDQLHLTNSQIGVLLSAFFWTYTPGQLLAGWLAERINAYRTLALGLAIWSVATAATGLAGAFGLLIGLRLLLGLGESAIFPCSSKLFAQHLPTHKLGAANGLVGVGLALGPAFGTFFGGMIMAQTGWRPTFLIFGLASLLWLVPWMLSTREASRAAGAAEPGTAPRLLEILRHPSAWGAGLGHFCNNWAFYFVISWLPLYLVKQRHFSVGQMAEVAGVIYLVYAASTMATGWISDRWMAAGASDTVVRKTFTVASAVGVAACLAVCALSDGALAIGALMAAGVCFGFMTPTIYAVGQTLAGPRGGGVWVSYQNGVGNIAGIIGPIVTGWVVDATHQFAAAFLIAGGVSLFGAIGWGLMIRRVEPIAWRGA
jgi:MFS family permease